MAKLTATLRNASESELCARAAWLHFVAGLTQSEIAKRLELPNTRVHRYIARAQTEGLVRVFVDVESADCAALENELIAAYGLRMCRVAMDAMESDPLPLRALGALGGDYLMRIAVAGSHEIVGVGHGRTIAASVEAMGRVTAADVRFVSMLGGLTRSFAANPYDVIHQLAKKTGAEAYFMPAPLFADSADVKRMLLGQSALAATTALMAEASLIVVGVGGLDMLAGGSTAAALEGPEPISALRAAGAKAEILGQFIDADGQPVKTPHDDRVMAAGLETLRGRDVVAIAGGVSKAEAIAAALKSGLLSGLIVDEATARRLVGGRRTSPVVAAE